MGFDPSRMSPAMQRQLEQKMMEQNPKVRAMRDMLTGKKPPSKYRAEKTWLDGISFDSKLEAEYYVGLKYRVAAGQLDGFLYHGRVILLEGTGPNDRGITYEPDFVLLKPDGTYEIVDTKGFETPEFKQKMKTLRSKYPKLQVRLERR